MQNQNHNPETESGKFATRREARTLAWHQLVADKIRQDPALLEKAKATLARWRETVCANPQPYLIEWERLIGLGMDACLAVAVEESQYAAALRKSSPFVGILTENERSEFLKSWGIEVVPYDIFAHANS